MTSVARVWEVFGKVDPVWGALFGFLSVIVSGVFMLINRRIDAKARNYATDTKAEGQQNKSEKELRADMLEYARTLHEDFDNMREELKRMQSRAEEAERKLEKAQADLDRANERIQYLEECQCHG